MTRNTSFAQTYSPSLVDRFGVWLSARQIRRWAPSFQHKRVGDFGCGYHANFTRTIINEAMHVTLADVALSEELKKNKKIQAIEGLLPDTLFSIPDSSFDVVLCISVLEHLVDPLRTLQELWRVLAHDGLLLLNVPSWRGKWFLEFSAFRLGTSPADEMDDHKRYYDVRDLWPLFVKVGFKPRDIRCFSHKFGLNTFSVCKARKVD